VFGKGAGEFDAMPNIRSLLQSFCQKFLDGTLQPTLKSAPIPPKNDGSVKIVVADTFWNTLNTNKDVLLLVYAPCKFTFQHTNLQMHMHP
jgi:hypothetical protein